MDPGKIRTILEWERPTTVKGLRSFLGFANFYRTFIDRFSKICTPLTSLTGKGIPWRWRWRWREEHTKAFELLKKKFISEPTLAQCDPDQETMIEADYSGYALGGCLLQKYKEGIWMPVSYYSRKLSGAEMNHEIHVKELLAIIACTKEFRYRLVYRKGSENERADALSRRDQDKPMEGDPRLLSRERQLLNPVNITKLFLKDLEVAEGKDIFANEDLQALWNEALLQDTNYSRIIQAVQSNERGWPKDLKVQTEGSDEPKPLKATIASATFDQGKGLLYYQGRIWVPIYEPLTTALIQNTHDSTISGHPSVKRFCIVVVDRTDRFSFGRFWYLTDLLSGLALLSPKSIDPVTPIPERPPPKSCENSGIMNTFLPKEQRDIIAARQRRELAWHARVMICTTVISSTLESFVDEVEKEEVVAFKAYLRQAIAAFAAAESTAIPPQIPTNSRPNRGTGTGARKYKSNNAVATPRTI
ncbi:hypothetical protein EPUL_004205 [Erysiphe pulchra]|uniref:Reverse transcriptase/retrotransposon-derived protein RNase H-like domain-containing protein n=1 Tax=Erysiphe pulchra TaxID=225359 RepID=A0A2S4PPQ3_9PEZI|nr:hypothetical protein EPUL_004205 [Erysiphe pulchra]